MHEQTTVVKRSWSKRSDRKAALSHAQFLFLKPAFHLLLSLLLTLSILISCSHQLGTFIPEHSITPSPLACHLAAVFLNTVVSLPLVHSCCCFACRLHLPITTQSSQIHRLHWFISLHQCLDSMGGIRLAAARGTCPSITKSPCRVSDFLTRLIITYAVLNIYFTSFTGISWLKCCLDFVLRGVDGSFH